ncbi:MAG: hypothetical protein ABWY06_08870 [Pseudomonas sp.]|uniref:hypothetical protein n=1 Tax=Pseudomonas sp. TaxID=306 RepID=UPI00339A7699
MAETDAAPAVVEPPAPPSHPWAELGPEHFRLLRLAPLPTDRGTGARPLRFVQLGRLERHSREQSLLRLTLQLPGQRVRKEQNVLEVWADHRNQELRFGPDAGLHIEPLNRGLGRFLLAQGIAWAQQKYANYQVEGGALSIKDVPNDEARLRRDRMLNAQGFSVEYLDPLMIKASYSAPRASALHGDWHGEKVQLVELLDAAAMLQQADQNLREQDVKLRKLDQRMEAFQREDSTLRFTIACLVAFSVFQAGLLIWIATR